MSWDDVVESFKELVGRRPSPPTFARIEDPELPAIDALVPGSSYFTISVKRMQLDFDRVLWKAYYPVVQAYVELAREGANEVVIPVVAGPTELAEPGTRSASLVLVRDVEILAPTPYIGGQVRVALGLFATQANDYLGNLVSILGSISGVIGGSSLTAALNVVQPLKAGVEALFGLTDDVALQVGIERSFDSAVPGYYAIIDKPEAANWAKALRYRDNQLLVEFKPGQWDEHPEGVLWPVEEDHVVFMIGSQQHLDQYSKIPGLFQAQQDLKTAAINHGLASDQFKDKYAAFRLAVAGNVDLVETDRKAIIAAAYQNAKEWADGAPVETHDGESEDEALRRLVDEGRAILSQ